MRFQEDTQEQERGRKRKGLIGTEDMVKTKREDLEKETRKEREAGKNLLEAETFKVYFKILVFVSFLTNLQSGK